MYLAHLQGELIVEMFTSSLLRSGSSASKKSNVTGSLKLMIYTNPLGTNNYGYRDKYALQMEVKKITAFWTKLKVYKEVTNAFHLRL